MIKFRKKIFAPLIIVIVSCSCNTSKSHGSSEFYEIINSYYVGNPEIDLQSRTINIEQYVKGLDNLSAWQKANDDLSNNDRKNIDFQSLFEKEEFSRIIDSFISKESLKLRDKFLKDNIHLNKKAKNAVSQPYTFTKDGVKYALMYSEMNEGPESAAGGIIMFKKENGIWKGIFYLHLWIS